MPKHLIGASVWEDELYKHLTEHEQNERGFLEGYQQAADASSSPAFRYLVSLIMEDEIRHHRLFRDLADSLRTDAELGGDAPKIPRLENLGRDASQRQQIMELTEPLLEQERRDAKELRRLAKELHDMKDTTLWQLLVELMEADTAKHVHILEFVEKHARHPLW